MDSTGTDLDSLSKSFFDQTLDLACLAAGDQFVRLNDRWCDALGWTNEQLKSKTFLDFVHQDDQETTVETIAKLYRGESVVAFENRYLGADGSWHWLAWNATLDQASQMILATARDVTKEHLQNDQRERAIATLAFLAEMQHRYIAEDGTSRSWWDYVLGEVLSLTGSKFGFIGRVERDEEDAPYLVTQAVTDIAWNDWSRAHYEEFVENGLEFRNLESLFGVTLASGESVIANDPASDPRRGGLPEGHPPLNSYLGIPLPALDGMVGMIGLANRDGGFDQSLIDDLQPISDALGQILDAASANRDKQRMAIERNLTASALAVSRSTRTADALATIREAIAQIDPGAETAFFAFRGEATTLERIDQPSATENPHFPMLIHEASCLA
ncbi:MAG: GAF domain-containing protein, partial [Actinobacteria bacterium]|nr:GAF domain-containing protein [Actinomycetota bacterium]